MTRNDDHVKVVDDSQPLDDVKDLAKKPDYELPIPRWVISLIGHLIAAPLGLVLGYLILSWLRPQTFPLPW